MAPIPLSTQTLRSQIFLTKMFKTQNGTADAVWCLRILNSRHLLHIHYVSHKSRFLVGFWLPFWVKVTDLSVIAVAREALGRFQGTFLSRGIRIVKLWPPTQGHVRLRHSASPTAKNQPENETQNRT